MGLARLARELEETARQAELMAAGVSEGLALLAAPAAECAIAREQAVARIVMALQMQDRIEQRCRGLATTARALHAAGGEAIDGTLDRLWTEATLDELRDERYARETRSLESGEIELF